MALRSAWRSRSPLKGKISNAGLVDAKRRSAGSTYRERRLAIHRRLANRHIVIDLAQRISALANDNRIAVLRWLADPRAHFPPQVHADIEEVGVCGVFIADKLGVTPATASAHMRLLVDAGFVTARRLGKWTYFKRQDAALAAIGRDLTEL